MKKDDHFWIVYNRMIKFINIIKFYNNNDDECKEFKVKNPTCVVAKKAWKESLTFLRLSFCNCLSCVFNYSDLWYFISLILLFIYSGCLLGVGDQRILRLLCRILWLTVNSLWLFFTQMWSLFKNILLQHYNFLLLLEFLMKTLPVKAVPCPLTKKLLFTY